MAAATATPVATRKPPPPPHLGDFRQIFDNFLKSNSNADYKLELERRPSTQETTKQKARERAQIRRELLRVIEPRSNLSRSPRMIQACRRLHEGTLNEFSPGSPQDPDHVIYNAGLADTEDIRTATADFNWPTILNSPSGSSDTTLNSGSTAGSPRYSTSATTPPGSAEKAVPFPTAVQLGSSPPASPPGVGSDDLRRLGDFNGIMASASTVAVNKRNRAAAALTPANGRGHPETPRSRADKPRAGVAETEFSASPSTTGKPCLTYKTASSSASPYRYTVLPVQPYKGIKLYSVVSQYNKGSLVPRYMSTKEDKEGVLICKLAPTLHMDKKLKATFPVASKPIHVFVDLSNITIGFYDCLKVLHGLPITKKIKAPRFSFEHLALVLERGRPTAKKIVAGSLVNAQNRKWPEYMQEAKDLGYEMNILQRVPKAAQSPSRKKPRRGNFDVELATSSAESSGEEAHIAQLKQGEQGVDEILHLKMLQSALDSEPGTVVLATGDAAAAEYSDGFKKNVERLLQSGWNVEIIGWSKGISSAWRDHVFTKTWAGRVRLIELDTFAEELFGVWFNLPGY